MYVCISSWLRYNNGGAKNDGHENAGHEIAVFRYWALSLLGHEFDLSGLRDVIGHMTIWSLIGTPSSEL